MSTFDNSVHTILNDDNFDISNKNNMFHIIINDNNAETSIDINDYKDNNNNNNNYCVSDNIINVCYDSPDNTLGCDSNINVHIYSSKAFVSPTGGEVLLV